MNIKKMVVLKFVYFYERVFMMGEPVPHCVARLPHILFTAVYAREGINHSSGRAGEGGVYRVQCIIFTSDYSMF